jgi:hypothetical protein
MRCSCVEVIVVAVDLAKAEADKTRHGSQRHPFGNGRTKETAMVQEASRAGHSPSDEFEELTTGAA